MKTSVLKWEIGFFFFKENLSNKAQKFSAKLPGNQNRNGSGFISLTDVYEKPTTA